MTQSIVGPALEKGVYSSFRNAFVTWRQAAVGSKLVDLKSLTLPNNSVLHIADRFLDAEVPSILPDLNNPLIHNEKFKKYLENVLTIPGKDALFPIVDKYRFRPFRYNQEIRKFWIDHRQTINRATSRSAMLGLSNTLPIINYNAILTPLVTGTFVYYRRFDILLRTLLDNIVTIEGKHQYLQIPLSRTVYRKIQFSQTFDAINYLTVRIKTDPSFFFLIHLINFTSKTATSSLFSQLPQTTLDCLNIVLTAGDECIVYNLGDLKAIVDARQDNNFYQLVLRHVNTLKLAGYADRNIAHLNETEYDKLIDAIAPNDSHEPDNTEPEQTPTPPPAPVVLPAVKSEPVAVPKPTVTPTITPTPEPTKPVIVHNPTKGAKPVEKTPTTALVRQDHIATDTLVPPQHPTSLLHEIDRGAYHAIMSATHLTEDQKAAALKAAQIYKTLKIDGVTIEEHLQQTAEPPVTNNHLSCLQGKLPDPSMLNSRAIDLDKHYLDHVMAHDLAAVVAQMATNGMFLVKTEQHDEVTQLNRIRHYKTVYQDLNGRHHTVVFKFPIVSSDGTLMINGIESRMIKQQVNLPICKIDSNRVSLASSYNKTLVERIATRAHTYSAYISRYIDAVYKAKVGLTLSYGNLTTEHKLPYDYSSLARRYSALSFSIPTTEATIEPTQYRFCFDYAKRFNLTESSFSTEALSAPEKARKTALEAYEAQYGVYCGVARIHGHTYRLFFGYDNTIRHIGPNRGKSPIADSITFTDLMVTTFGREVPPPKQFSEWTELKILDKNFPIVFILGFEYGLQRVLDHIKLDYQFVPEGTRFARSATTIAVPFADGTLVFDRYPLEQSFVVSGLLKYTTKPYAFAKFNTQDAYYALLQDSGISLNYLKGITDFFKLFIDPITRDVLLRMHEPITVGELLLRATAMLTTEDAIPSASMRNHRLRGYERFNATLYNEMARSYAAFSKQRGNRRAYSINPEAVFQRLIQDQTLHIVEEINPVENVKDKHAATYTGSGGRTAQSFVIPDRRFPEDGIGILSEATPDNGKVSINTYVTADPIIANIRGMFDLDHVDIHKLEPAQLLSVTSLLMPCSTNDD